MKIVVCIKHVPDTETKIVIVDDGKSINSNGVKYILNPYDEYAVEEALQIKEANEESEVVAISVGDDSTQSSIRSALAMGVDRGTLLKTGNFALVDPFSVAKILAEEIKLESPDIILTGKMSIDAYGSQVPGLIAELLELPVVNLARDIVLSEGKATVKRDIEGGSETLITTLPAVISAEKGLNNPRYPALKGIMQAKKKPLEIKEINLDETDVEIIELTYPKQKPAGRIVGNSADAAVELVKLLRQEAKVI